MTPSAHALQAMIAKVYECLSSATAVLSAGFPGAASSRAYYAAFHAACAALAMRGMAFSSHRETLGAFDRHLVKSGLLPVEYAPLVRRLFQNRQTADYDIETSIDQQTAVEDIAAATAIVHACRAIVEAPHR